MPPFIIFVDDESRLIDTYIQELEFEFESKVKHISNADKLLEFIIDTPEKIDLLILDVMIPPENIDEFYNKNTQKGMETGLILYEIIRENKIIKEKHPLLPIIIFTNVSKNEKNLIVKKINQDRQADFLQKEDYLPFELAEKIKDFI